MEDNVKNRRIFIYLSFFVLSVLIVIVLYLHQNPSSNEELYIERTKTKSGLLDRKNDDPELMDRIPSLDDLKGDAIRFFADSPASPYSYTVVISERGSTNLPSGIIRRFSRVDGKLSATDKKFIIPPSQFDYFMDILWRSNIDFEGSKKKCLDGARFSYEQRRNNLIISGTNWRGCADHYTEISRFILSSVKEWISPTGLPENDDWTYRNYENE